MTFAPVLHAETQARPVAILTRIDSDDTLIDFGDHTTSRKPEVGELIVENERVKGHAVVVECNGSASRQWYPRTDAPYVGGKGVEGSKDVTALKTGCRMPDLQPSATQAAIDEQTADQLDAQLARFATSTSDRSGAALTGLTPPDARDGMSILRYAQDVETRGQLSEALRAYVQLMALWDKAPWVWPKICALRITLARKLLQAGPAPGLGHITPVVIGVSKYLRPNDTYQLLHYADSDANDFTGYLKEIDRQRVSEPLVNDGATSSGIRDKLASLQAHAGDRSTAVVFLSAHGWQDPRGSYIAPYDADFQEPKDTGVSIIEVLNAVREFTRSLVFVDACRTPLPRGYQNDVNTFLWRYGGPNSRETGVAAPLGKQLLASSSSAGSPSDEGPQYGDSMIQGGHGAFTYHLLKVLYLSPGSKPRPLSKVEFTFDLLKSMKGLHQTPQITGNMFDTDELGPVQQVAVAAKRPTSLIDWLKSPFRLVSYSPEPQAGISPQFIEQLRSRLAPRVITVDLARSVVSAYLNLAPADQIEIQPIIRVALENEGQRLLLEYLRGYEQEPPKTLFTSAAEYYGLALRLAPNSLLLKAREAFNQGRALLFDVIDPQKRNDRDRNYRTAVSRLFDAYRLDSGPYVLNALGIAYMEQSEWEKAIVAFDDATKLAPDWLYPRQNRALTLMRSGKARAAIDEYRNAIAKLPSAFTLHFNLALAYQQINRLKDAEREYDQTERLLSHSVSADALDRARLYNAEGTLAAQRGKRGTARKLYEKAQALPEAVHNLALISKPDEEERLLKGNRAYLNSRIELARIYQRSGRVKEAIAEYKAIVALREDFAAAHLDLAQLYLRDNLPLAERLDSAEKELLLAMRAGSEFWQVYLVKAEIARLREEIADAKTDYRAARGRAPDREALREISKSEKGKWMH